ncbi:MAG: hypothetical protein HC836_42685 [Richelia sp. RM2_1_2]|nr:hypothetical protein [Richelia sp. RM1_1_1]NJO64615.1 hypothetical protein [Richelia sp. RM2_1_2]
MNYLATGKVAYPKVSIYAFHLWRNLAQGIENPVKNAKDLWLKFQEVGQTLNTPELKKLPELIETNNHQLGKNGELLPRYLRFSETPQSNNLNLTGEILPLQIHDTYAVDCTLRYQKPEVKIADLKGLNKDNCLLPNNINASLGQTLVFFATPLEEFENQESLQSFADDCVKALISEKKFQKLEIYCQNQGKLLGSPIFEYNNDNNSPEEQCHILIWLNTNPQTTELENTGEYYYPLINLLLCRSKIVYVHHQANWCNRQARREYIKLENIVKEFNCIPNEDLNSCLDKFQVWLKNTPDKSFKYARNIRDLQLHRTTIITNTTNYKLHLQEINKLYNNDSQFLLDFLKLAQKTYIQQITTDLAYLIPGQKLFENMVETIRGIVEIEEAKRDRSLERTIQVIGAGLGSGAIIGGAVTQHIDKPFKPLDSKSPVHPMIPSLFWSIVATIAGGLLTWLWIRRAGKN